MSEKLSKLRTSKAGNDIYELPLGTTEGIKSTFKSGNKGFRIASTKNLGGKSYRFTGYLVEM